MLTRLLSHATIHRQTCTSKSYKWAPFRPGCRSEPFILYALSLALVRSDLPAARKVAMLEFDLMLHPYQADLILLQIRGMTLFMASSVARAVFMAFEFCIITTIFSNNAGTVAVV